MREDPPQHVVHRLRVLDKVLGTVECVGEGVLHESVCCAYTDVLGNVLGTAGCVGGNVEGK